VLQEQSGETTSGNTAKEVKGKMKLAHHEISDMALDARKVFAMSGSITVLSDARGTRRRCSLLGKKGGGERYERERRVGCEEGPWGGGRRDSDGCELVNRIARNASRMK
jgi:hypothetical protein